MPDRGKLEENLELAKDAVAYAKGLAPLSTTRTYVRWRSSPSDAAQKRRALLLAITRHTDYELDDQRRLRVNDQRRAIRAQVRAFVESGNRVGLEHYLNTLFMRYSNLTSQAFARGMDSGAEFFFRQGLEIDDMTSRMKTANPDWWRQVHREVGGFTDAQLDPLNPAFRMAIDITSMRQMAQYAARTGVGNCDEKAQLAAEYIYLHSPADKWLAMCKRDQNYLNGDHVFAIYGCDGDLTNKTDVRGNVTIAQLGPDAILVDGWMHDAYPAQHSSFWNFSYSKDYLDRRISLAQVGVRSDNCSKWGNHINVRWCYILSAGQVVTFGSKAARSAHRAILARGTAQYRAVGTGTAAREPPPPPPTFLR